MYLCMYGFSVKNVTAETKKKATQQSSFVFTEHSITGKRS